MRDYYAAIEKRPSILYDYVAISDALAAAVQLLPSLHEALEEVPHGANRDRLARELEAHERRLDGYRGAVANFHSLSKVDVNRLLTIGLMLTNRDPSKPNRSPVPDALFSLYFLRQAGIVAEEENILPALGRLVGDIAERSAELAAEANDAVMKTFSMTPYVLSFGVAVAAGLAVARITRKDQ